MPPVTQDHVDLPGSATLSARGRSALVPPPAYLLASFAARTDAYDAEHNPEGTVDLSVAENRLSLPYVAEGLGKAPPIPPASLTYEDMRGTLKVRTTLARVLSTHLTHTKIPPGDIAITAGAGSTVDLLASYVCDPGDRVMITAPAYRGLENDVSHRAGCVVVSAQLDLENDFAVTVDALERAWENAGGEHSKIKLCIVCTPNNPTGEVLEKETIVDIAEWSKRRRMHIIFDEVYGMSCFTKPFVSAAEALDDGLLETTHIVWSFSKDFCISGVRMGVLYSKNQALHSAFGNGSYFASTSRHTQWAVKHMLEDDAWLTKYIEDNRKRLHVAYEKTVATLRELDIPYVPSHAGFFVLVNLSKWMSAKTSAAEEALWSELVGAKVLVTPAAQMLSTEYGWFRLCFAASTEDALEVALQRIGDALSSLSTGGQICE